MHVYSLMYPGLQSNFVNDDPKFWDCANSELIIELYEMLMHVKIAHDAVNDYNNLRYEEIKGQAYLYEDELQGMSRSTDLINNALFISIYGLIELQANRLCKIFEKGRKIRVNDIVGNGMARSVDYLEKVCEIQLKASVEWQAINEYRSLRNCIAHAAGNLDDSTDSGKIITLCNKHGIKIEEGISIDYGNIEKLTKYGMEFLKSAIVQLNGKNFQEGQALN